MDEVTQRIDHRAYEIWERKGRKHGDDIENWLEAEQQVTAERQRAGADGRGAARSDESANEGEGNQTGARVYNRAAAGFAKSGKVDAKAREAAEAVDGPQGPSLRRAEETGKAHSHGEDPALTK